MKYIFVIHSNITYLISLGIIAKEGLSDNNVLILSDGYNCEGPIPIKVITVEPNRHLLKQSIKKYIQLYFNPAHELYSVIDKFLKGDKFIAFVPVLHLSKKLVLLHDKCEQFHFIEEGTASYYSSMTFDEYAIVYRNKGWFYKKGFRGILERLHVAYKEFGFKTGKIESIPISYMNHDSIGRKFYGLSEMAYPAIKFGEKIIVKVSSLLDSFTWVNDISLLSNVSVWIGDPDIADRYGYDSFKQCIIERLIPAIKNNTLYIRYHYRESEIQRKIFTDILDNYSVVYRVIDEKQIMELIFLKSNNCKCYSFGSSLSMYAKILGHESYSIAKGISPFYRNIEEVMPCFSKFVTYI